MNIVADESVDRQLVCQLREDGYRVWYIAGESRSIKGQTDAPVQPELTAQRRNKAERVPGIRLRYYGRCDSTDWCGGAQS